MHADAHLKHIVMRRLVLGVVVSLGVGGGGGGGGVGGNVVEVGGWGVVHLRRSAPITSWRYIPWFIHIFILWGYITYRSYLDAVSVYLD